MTWDTIPLGEIAVRRGGSVDPRKHPDEQFDLYSIPAFDTGTPEITAGSEVGSSKKVVQPDDVILSRIVPHIRRAWVVGEANGRRQIASSEWIIFRSEEVWPQYLRWVLVDDAFHSAFMRTVSGVGGSLLRARPAEVYHIQIPLPPLAEQKRIARILDAADALRAKRRDALAQLDTLIQSIFLDMFGDPVTNPMGWEVFELGDLAEFINGDRGKNYPSKSDFLENGIPFINAGHLINGEVRFAKMNYISEDRYGQLGSGKTRPKDILYCLRGSLGKSAIVRHTGPAAIASSLVIIRPSEKCNVEYLFRYLVSPFGKREIHRFDTGSSQPNLSAASVKKYRICVPPIDLQHRFATIVESIERQKARQRAHLAELDTLFASLQSRAFADEL